MHTAELKVTADHLRRDAYLYVRQSTPRQVVENVESTRRQYALRDRAIAAGWPADRIHVIDNDLGKSGSSATAQDGFQRLVSEVALGQAGIVMGLEVSRLARNSADWHRLIELCSLSGTLILDEDGIYDPASFNDRLLLGLKGTMSEAELHIIKARLRGGVLNKARRGELEIRPPVGLVYRPDGKIILDPNVEVQSAIRMMFETFERTASAMKTAQFLHEQGLQFPSRLQSGPNKGELVWALPRHSRVLQVLHNPRYAGAFVFGRMRTRRRPDGGVDIIKLPMEDWQFVIKGAHPGYIDWERFEANQQRLTDNVLREGYGLPSHHERLRRRGLLTTHELADRFQVTDSTIRHWGRQDLITNHYPDSRVSALWELPAGYTIARGRLVGPTHLVPITTNQTNEVLQASIAKPWWRAKSR